MSRPSNTTFASTAHRPASVLLLATFGLHICFSGVLHSLEHEPEHAHTTEQECPTCAVLALVEHVAPVVPTLPCAPVAGEWVEGAPVLPSIARSIVPYLSRAPPVTAFPA